MKKYKILENDSTLDFCESLIGMVFEGEKVIENGTEYIELNTCDGRLIFEDDEVQEIIKKRNNPKYWAVKFLRMDKIDNNNIYNRGYEELTAEQIEAIEKVKNEYINNIKRILNL